MFNFLGMFALMLMWFVVAGVSGWHTMDGQFIYGFSAASVMYTLGLALETYRKVKS